jgi:hypothetical protein
MVTEQHPVLRSSFFRGVVMRMLVPLIIGVVAVASCSSTTGADGEGEGEGEFDEEPQTNLDPPNGLIVVIAGDQVVLKEANALSYCSYAVDSCVGTPDDGGTPDCDYGCVDSFAVEVDGVRTAGTFTASDNLGVVTASGCAGGDQRGGGDRWL